MTCKAQARNAWHGARLSLSLAVAEDSLASAKLELRSALRSPFAIFDCIEDWLRRSPYASTVLEQVRDGIRLKRGFGCGSAMSIKQVCCHCAHLSLSLLFRYRCVRKVDAKGGI